MTVSDKLEVQVQNLADHQVVFIDDDLRKRFTFRPQEIKKIPAEILRRLYYSHGGQVLLQDYLSVKNKELAREFGVLDETIEYNWTQADVDNLLTNGSLDQLLDALDFGPEAIKIMIVDRAVDLKLDNVSKRQAILDKTGSNITQMINLKEAYEKELGTDGSEKTQARRRVSQSTQETRVDGRRVQN